MSGHQSALSEPPRRDLPVAATPILFRPGGAGRVAAAEKCGSPAHAYRLKIHVPSACASAAQSAISDGSGVHARVLPCPDRTALTIACATEDPLRVLRSLLSLQAEVAQVFLIDMRQAEPV